MILECCIDEHEDNEWLRFLTIADEDIWVHKKYDWQAEQVIRFITEYDALAVHILDAHKSEWKEKARHFSVRRLSKKFPKFLFILHMSTLTESYFGGIMVDTLNYGRRNK